MYWSEFALLSRTGVLAVRWSGGDWGDRPVAAAQRSRSCSQHQQTAVANQLLLLEPFTSFAFQLCQPVEFTTRPHYTNKLEVKNY